MDDQLEPPPSKNPEFTPIWIKWIWNFYKFVLANVSKDFFFEVAQGNVNGYSLVQVFGHQEAVSTAEITLWDTPTPVLYAYPSSAVNMTLSSTDANDTSAGSGAQTVRVTYLTTGYVEEISDDMAMNGTTGVTVQKDASNSDILRINKIEVITVGATGWNEGAIYIGTGSITAGVPAVNNGLINIGHSESLMGFYTVPVNKTAYSSFPWFSNDANQTTEALLVHRNQTGPLYKKKHIHFKQDIADNALNPYIKFLEKTDIELRAETGAGTGAVSGSIELILVDN